MKRILLLLAAFAVVSVGCAATPPAGHRMGSGSINAPYSEAVSLATGDVYSTPIYIGTIDVVGVDLYAASGTAACSVTPQISNRYNQATDSPTDGTKWVDYAPSGWTAPAALTGAVSNYFIEITPISGRWFHIHYNCASGTTTLTQTTQVKGS